MVVEILNDGPVTIVIETWVLSCPQPHFQLGEVGAQRPFFSGEDKET
jgi:hypothetical protein